jgi:hypothetical protein
MTFDIGGCCNITMPSLELGLVRHVSTSRPLPKLPNMQMTLARATCFSDLIPKVESEILKLIT